MALRSGLRPELTPRSAPFGAQAPSEREDATLDLVRQAATFVQNVKAEAQEQTTRATDIARRATEMLTAAEQRIKSLESAQSAAAQDLRSAHARIGELEQGAGKSQAQIKFLQGALAEAEQRAKNAELKVEETIASIQKAIRSELLALGPAPKARLAAAA
jgi:flagellar biosynthesis chaperone FliJ